MVGRRIMFSFIFNRMGFLLNQSGHHHAHSHSLPSNSSTTGSGCGHNHGQDSLAVRAAFVHALGDLVQSVGVLIAAYIIRFKVRRLLIFLFEIYLISTLKPKVILFNQCTGNQCQSYSFCNYTSLIELPV